MGISSTKRGIRTHAANQEYRDNWERMFAEKPKAEPGYCNCGQTFRLAEDWRDHMNPCGSCDGGTKKKAPTPVKESRPAVDTKLADSCPSRSCGCYQCCRQYDLMYPKH